MTTASNMADSSDSNTLNLTLAALGVDPKGYWRCFSGPNDITRNSACWRTNAQAMLNSYSSQPAYGFQGPVYAAIDVIPAPFGLELRASLAQTGTAATCKGTNRSPTGVRIVSLNGMQRYVLSSMRAALFSAWLCGFSDGLPRNVSTINITDELELLGLSPLEPGPYISLDLTFNEALSSAHQTVMQENLCSVVWDAVDDNCVWRVASTTTSLPIQKLWKVSFKMIMKSNSNAARASFLLSKLANSDVFRAQYPLKEKAYYASVATPSAKYGNNSVYGCASHYDCMAGMFCSLSAQQIWGVNYVGGGAACDLCQYCLSDYVDAIDKWCPRDKCGAKSGSYPSCINAARLFDGFNCPSIHTINLTKIPDFPVRLSNIKNGTQTVARSGRTKARFLSPFNQLVGALTVTQRRVNGTCIYKDDNVGAYSRMKDPAQGQICRGLNVDSRPFGFDPAFLSSSPIYDGTLDATLYYNSSERNPQSVQAIPYGFFPHEYDGQNRSMKSPHSVVAEQAQNIILYFEERLSGAQAQKLITYMGSGGFIDSQTDSVSVDAITLNSQLNVFGKVSFTFNWQVIFLLLWIWMSTILFLYSYQRLDDILFCSQMAKLFGIIQLNQYPYTYIQMEPCWEGLFWKLYA